MQVRALTSQMTLMLFLSRFKLVGSGPSRRHNDGINSINYQHMSITQHDLYTRVYVKVDQKEVMQVCHYVNVSVLIKLAKYTR